MADTTKKRRRTRRRRQRGATTATPIGPRPSGGPEPLPPPDWPEDLDGGAGVREPRRPYPGAPAGAMALDEPVPAALP